MSKEEALKRLEEIEFEKMTLNGVINEIDVPPELRFREIVIGMIISLKGGSILYSKDDKILFEFTNQKELKISEHILNIYQDKYNGKVTHIAMFIKNLWKTTFKVDVSNAFYAIL